MAVQPLFFLCIVLGRAWKASSESCAFCKRNKNIHLGFLAPSCLSEHSATDIQVHCGGIRRKPSDPLQDESQQPSGEHTSPFTGQANQNTFCITFPKSLNSNLFDAQHRGRRCAESDRHFYTEPFYFSILNGSTLLALTSQSLALTLWAGLQFF